jgi:hypothetical protein
MEKTWTHILSDEILGWQTSPLIPEEWRRAAFATIRDITEAAEKAGLFDTDERDALIAQIRS